MWSCQKDSQKTLVYHPWYKHLAVLDAVAIAIPMVALHDSLGAAVLLLSALMVVFELCSVRWMRAMETDRRSMHPAYLNMCSTLTWTALVLVPMGMFILFLFVVGDTYLSMVPLAVGAFFAIVMIYVMTCDERWWADFKNTIRGRSA